jgi:tetratricopeptide (TPR) repeat protein
MDKYEEWFNKGVENFKNKEFRQAIECFNEALKLNEDDSNLFLSLGFIYFQIRENEKALEYFKRAVKLDDRLLIGWEQIGIIYMDELEYNKAIQSFQKILEFAPDYKKAAKMTAVCKRQISLFSILKPQLEELSEPLREKFLQGIRLANQGKNYESNILYKEVIDVNPNFSPTWTWLATNLSNSGEFELAIDHFNKAIDLAPNDFMAWANKGLALNRLNRFEEAIKCYDRAIEINPQYSSSWNNKGLALKDLKRYEESIECFDQSISVNPNLEFGWLNKAEVLVKLGRPEEAIECYKETLKLNPSINRAKEMIDHLRIEISMADARFTGKIESIINGKNYCPRCSEKDYTNSPLCPNCGFEMDSINIDAFIEDAIKLENIGEFEQAIYIINQVLNVNPTNGHACFLKGKALVALTDTKTAKIFFQKAQHFGFHDSSLILLSLTGGSINPKLEKPEFSLERIEQLDVNSSVVSPNEEDWNYEGTSRQMLGFFEEAYKCFEKSLEVNPSYTPAFRNKERLITIFQGNSNKSNQVEICKNCGSQIKINHKFCINCGKKL